MYINITQKLAGVVALLTGGLLGIGAVIAKRLAPNGADVASVFVTNGGYNGVQQVLRLSTPFAKGVGSTAPEERQATKWRVAQCPCK
jgi:NAD(P)-dependent dehydrogenase (short-subunit alcohol dehydrogenase family)